MVRGGYAGKGMMGTQAGCEEGKTEAMGGKEYAEVVDRKMKAMGEEA